VDVIHEGKGWAGESIRDLRPVRLGQPGSAGSLHLLRSDGSTVLGTVAQERQAWLELTDRERERWLQVAPDEIAFRS
jgi:hypothetical protein